MPSTLRMSTPSCSTALYVLGGDRARHPPSAPRRDHRQPHRRLGHPAGPQHPDGPRRPRRAVPVPDPRYGTPSSAPPSTRCSPSIGIRITRTLIRAPRANAIVEQLHRDAAPRMPRSPLDHRTTPPCGSLAGVRRALQHPTAHTNRLISDRPPAALPRPPARSSVPYDRDRLGGLVTVRARRMTSTGSRHPQVSAYRCAVELLPRAASRALSRPDRETPPRPSRRSGHRRRRGPRPARRAATAGVAAAWNRAAACCSANCWRPATISVGLRHRNAATCRAHRRPRPVCWTPAARTPSRENAWKRRMPHANRGRVGAENRVTPS